ncbi:MAG TPA: hypothetical protein VIX20_14090 [Ktedonobacteraceae bacterium]
MNSQSSVTTAVKSPEEHNRSDRYLHGAWLVIARIAWVTLSILAVGLFVASLPSYFAYLHILGTSSYASPQISPSDVRALQRLGLSLDFYAWFNIGVNALIMLVYVMVGVILFWRKSDDRVALLASLSLVLLPTAISTSIVGTLPAAWTVPTEIVVFLGNICMGLFFVFPSGRFFPRWARWLMLVWIAFWVISNFFPNVSITNAWLFFLLLPFLVISILILQVYRYRRMSTPVQRQQTKWVIFGIVFAFGSFVIGGTLDFFLLSHFFPKSPLVITLVGIPFNLMLFLFPISLGFAILRYRLWDIDRLVNRTLVYGSLTALLALLYFGLIFALQSLFQGVFHQNNAVAIVVSTLVIAALFQPLRHRIQRFIDRRFYRRKYDAAKTLEAFSATLRSEVDLNQLHDELVAVVQETMQPAHVSLWLRSPQRHTEEPLRRVEKPTTMKESF